MRFVEIKLSDTSLLDKFLVVAGSSLSKFRYYAKRDKSALATHLATLIGMEGVEPVAYGHLDIDGDTTWLGLCVAERWTHRGLGGQMMVEILRRADAVRCEVWLSVDAGNADARRLYEQHGFVEVRRDGDVVLMERGRDIPVTRRR